MEGDRGFTSFTYMSFLIFSLSRSPPDHPFWSNTHEWTCTVFQLPDPSRCDDLQTVEHWIDWTQIKGWNSSTLLESYTGISNLEISSWMRIANLKFVILAWVGGLTPYLTRMLHTWRNMSQLDGTEHLRLCSHTGEIFDPRSISLFSNWRRRKYNTASEYGKYLNKDRTEACIVDVWSIGCIIAELLIGAPLFKGKE